jgi:hypothetical protein
MTASLSTNAQGLSGSSAVVAGFSENAAAIQSVVNNLADSRSVWIDIHPITCTQVTHYPLCGDGQRRAAQLRVTARLNMINPLKPLFQRQMPVKSHFSSSFKYSESLFLSLPSQNFPNRF